MADRYANFAELSAHEVEGTEYMIESQNRGRGFVIVGIHGGRIEPVTAEIVRAIAGEDLSYYVFSGHRAELHITSTHFDEPQCLQLVEQSVTVITIHGKEGAEKFVMLGGLDRDLVVRAGDALADVGFELVHASSNVPGDEIENICNKGTSGKGLQIEVSRGLRDLLYRDTTRMHAFADAVRGVARNVPGDSAA